MACEYYNRCPDIKELCLGEGDIEGLVEQEEVQCSVGKAHSHCGLYKQIKRNLRRRK